jgi:parvulin-like peptidyl-prolyl isomerase
MKEIWSLALAGIAAVAVAQVDLNRTVATVNGEEIRGAEYYRRMEYLPGVGKMIGGSFASAAPGFLTLDQLINERLVLQLAKDKGVLPTDAEIKAQVKQLSDSNPRFAEQLAANGMTTADLEYQVKLELAQFKLQTRGVTVTDQEIEAHYKQNPTMYTIPKLVELRVITVDSDATRTEVDNELKSGKTFADVARTKSVDVSKVAGGQISPRPVESLEPEVKAALDKVKVGQTTDWIPTRGMYTKVLFEKATPQKTLPLDASLKDRIRKKLMFDRGTAKPENDLGKMMQNMRAKAKIEITDKHFADTYKRLMAQGKG